MNPIRHKTIKKHNNITVGIITIPHMKKTKYGASHIMKPYVDWFEERGVRVVPIPYETDKHEFYFNNVNGILIPGGETTFIVKNPTFINTIARFFELSFKKDEYFPIWGTCFGYEMLLFIIGGFSRLKTYPAQGYYPLHITPEGHVSRLFTSFSLRYLHYLENEKSCSNNHDYGISPADFMINTKLRNFYNIIATSIDDRGKEYVAAIEGKKYPVYGVQWHPERQKTTGPFVDFFISELKKNKHKTNKYIPYLRSSMKPHKCIQYPEHRELLCYFF
jgi:gamma-glutamyl hydrolase